MNWIIAIVVSIIYFSLMIFRKEKSCGYISLDLGFAFEQLLITIAYLIFWIVWLIIN